MIEPNMTSFLICSYTKSNNGAARGEPVEYICRSVESLWCAFGSLYVFCVEERTQHVSDLRETIWELQLRVREAGGREVANEVRTDGS